MPGFKRNYKPKRKPYRKTYGRRYKKYRMTKPMSNNVHRFKRHTYLTNGLITTVVGGTNGESIANGVDGLHLMTGAAGTSNFTYYSFGCAFKLDQLPNYAEFQSLYERYKINGVAIKLIPFSTQSIIGINAAPTQSQAVLIHSVIDTDDGIPIVASGTGVQSLRERVSYKVANALGYKNQVPYKRYCKPAIAVVAFSTVGTDYATEKNKWILTASADVEHYGHKFIIEVFSPNSSASYDIWFKTEVTYYMTLKDVH